MPRYNNPKKTRKYSTEFKIKAVLLSLQEDVQVKDAAESLDIHPFMLSRWRKEFREGKIKVDKRKKPPKPKLIKSENARIHELEKEIAWLKEENEILKKWQRFLAEQKRSASNS